LLEGAILLGIPLVVLGVCIGVGVALIASHVAAVAGVLLIVVGVITVIVFVLIFAVRFTVIAPAVVLEGQRPASSLGRSWRLVRKSSWRVFGITLLTSLIVVAAAAVLEIPFGIITAVIGHGSGGIINLSGGSTGNPSVVVLIIGAIGSIVAAAVTRPVLAGARVLLYTDLRMRREGLDIALQTAASQQDEPGRELGSVWSSQPGQRWPGPACS
jgi:hypothetical protein